MRPTVASSQRKDTVPHRIGEAPAPLDERGIYDYIGCVGNSCDFLFAGTVRPSAVRKYAGKELSSSILMINNNILYYQALVRGESPGGRASRRSSSGCKVDNFLILPPNGTCRYMGFCS